MHRFYCAVVALALVCAAQAISDAGASHVAEPLRHQGRRLLSNFYSDPDAQYQSSDLVAVDPSYKSNSYTTEAQRVKVAQYAQVAAVAQAGQNPDMDSILSMQASNTDISQLMAVYNQHVEAAAANSNPSASDSSPAATAVTDAKATSADDNSASPSNVLGINGWLKDTANKAAHDVADLKDSVKDSVAKKIHTSPVSTLATPTVSPSPAGVAAALEGHSQLYHRGAHTAAVTSTDAIGGPITLYNAYQSSDYDTKTHPAEAAIDGNIYTSSQTAVDTTSCSTLNAEGLYGTCGVMGECMTSPYYTGAYASTPSNPYWTAGFSSDISANYRVTHVVLTNRQECCRCPLAGAKIYIGNPSNLNVIATENPDLSKETTWQLCATVPEFSTDSPALIFSETSKYTETFLCSQSLVGKAIAIQLPASTTILTLAEVQVVGLQV